MNYTVLSHELGSSTSVHAMTLFFTFFINEQHSSFIYKLNPNNPPSNETKSRNKYNKRGFLMAASYSARINLMIFPKIEPQCEGSQGDQGLQAGFTDWPNAPLILPVYFDERLEEEFLLAQLTANDPCTLLE